MKHDWIILDHSHACTLLGTLHCNEETLSEYVKLYVREVNRLHGIMQLPTVGPRIIAHQTYTAIERTFYV